MTNLTKVLTKLKSNSREGTYGKKEMDDVKGFNQPLQRQSGK